MFKMMRASWRADPKGLFAVCGLSDWAGYGLLNVCKNAGYMNGILVCSSYYLLLSLFDVLGVYDFFGSVFSFFLLL